MTSAAEHASQQTPLHAAHVALGARMAPFGGWQMPIQYEGILAEHQWTRRRCSLFDTCHMGEFDIRGPNAEDDLERLLTQSIASLAVGQCRYGFLLDNDGGVIDDLICYRRGRDHFWLVVNAGTRQVDADWIAARLAADTAFTDLSEATAKLDVQGPETRAAVGAALGETLPDLGYFRFTDLPLLGVPCTLSRTGYTGEWGYEIYLPSAEVGVFWERLLAHEAIRPAGLGARDTLRLEMGYPLYGHELSRDRSPVAACRGQFIKATGGYPGQAVVERELADGVPRYLAGLDLGGRRAARAGDFVSSDGVEVGEVTSGSYGPSVETAIALAMVDAAHANDDERLQVRIRDRLQDARVVALPFYRNGTARRRAGTN